MFESVSLFSDLGEREIKELEGHAIVRSYPRNSVIIHEGDHSEALFVILSGRVKAFLGDEKGREIVLNDHGPGEYFGELALFDDLPRSASVITLEETTLAMISESAFKACLHSNPEVAMQVIRGLIVRLKNATENMRSLALLDVYGRIARLFLQLAREEEGRLVIREKLTQQDIADRVGSSREMVNRILKDLKAGGYIQMDKNHITIRERLPDNW